jgi:enamine deaminase RidA (YjgF/YER057c/UK114 family)
MSVRPIISVLLAVLALVAPMAGQQPAAPPFRPAVQADSLLYLSGALPAGPDGKIVAGDIKVQTRQALDNLKGVLDAHGARIGRVAAVSVYLKRASDFAAMNEVYRTYWPSDPPVRTTVIANLVVPDALVEIGMIAVTGTAERTVVHPATWVRSPNPYSYAIRSGDTLFLSGLVARNGRDNTPVRGDISVQTRAVLDNAGEILKAAGMDYRDVVSARVFLTDTASFDAMNATYHAYFPKDPPARATVRAGLTSPDFLVEIALTAVATRDRLAVTTPNADGSPGRANPNLSSAIRAGNRLFLSGMLGTTDGNAGEVGSQTREALARIGRTLRAAGFEWGHVVDSTVYLTDVTGAPGMNDAYRQVLVKAFPARATIEAGLVSPAAVVEIMMSAVKGSGLQAPGRSRVMESQNSHRTPATGRRPH